MVGLATAWRQADALREGGIGHTLALQPMLAAIASSGFVPTRNTVLVIDEVSQVGPRAMLALLELQARPRTTIKALGDPEQGQSIEAGDTIEIIRRALPKAELPELLTTVRQETERGRAIAGLFRGTRLGPYATEADTKAHRMAEVMQALDMKRADGTALLVGGDQDQMVGRIVDLYLQRRDHLRASGSRRGVTVSVPTNEDAADVSRAIRGRLKARGEIGADEVTYNAIDQRGETYSLPIATGDRLRLFRRTWATIGGQGGAIGNNGDVVEVLGRTEDGLRLRDKDGRIGDVQWRRLADPGTGRLLLGFGYAMTIDAVQGLTSGEHINGLPRGSAGVTAFKAYVAESRSRGATWTVISEAAVLEAERRSRALGDASLMTEADLWRRMAADLARKPYKALGMDLARTAQANLASAVDAHIRQSHRFQSMELDGRNPGQDVRRHVREMAVDRQLSGHRASLVRALQQTDTALREIGQDAAALDRSQRVRAFVRGLGEAAQPGRHSGRDVRRHLQAEAAREASAGRTAGLGGALQRNAQALRAGAGLGRPREQAEPGKAGSAGRDSGQETLVVPVAGHVGDPAPAPDRYWLGVGWG